MIDIELGIIREVEIPAGEAITIDASDTDPRWIKAPAEDLHIGHTNEPLYAGHLPTLITRSTLVREPNGLPSTVTVMARRPQGARHAERQEV